MGQIGLIGQTLFCRQTCLRRVVVAAAALALTAPVAISADAPAKKPAEKHHKLPDAMLKTGTFDDKAGKDAASKDSVAKDVAKDSVKSTDKAAPKSTPPPPQAWTVAEIEAAKQQCAVALKGLDAVAAPEEPKREGSCGTPAPFRLLSLGSKPQVAFDPPPLLTCDMIVSLSKWLKNDLQPLAKKHLASEIIKIETMSDYSCRAAYGRVGGKWSEHAFANALDIRGFVTAKAETASVLEGWGPTGRDIIAAAKAAASKAAADATATADANKAAAEKKNAVASAKPGPAPGPSNPPAGATTTTVTATSPPRDVTTSSTAASLPSLFRSTVAPLPASAVDPANTGLGFKEPSRLGGPKDKKDDAPTLGPKGQAALFLRGAHAAACKIFGTTLGPEANNAHRNHFHVDMAPRKGTKYCE